MILDILKKEIYSDNSYQIFLISTDRQGLSHIETIGAVQPISTEDIMLKEWLSFQTITNLNENPSVTLMIWNQKTNKGYALKGHLEEIRQATEGFIPEIEEQSYFPEIEWQLWIYVNKVVPIQSVRQLAKSNS